MRNIIGRLLDLLYPPRCMLCRKLLKKGEEGVCEKCRGSLQVLPPEEQRRDVKGIALCVAPFRYEGELRASLLRYKFSGLTAYSGVYADFLAKTVDENGISCDIITWVPLSRKRLRSRGYDQARLLAEALSERTGIPCEKLLEKRVNNAPQSSRKSAAERRLNAAGAYVCPCPARAGGKRILLVDDIVTTGSTMAECARVLQAAGCSSVTGAAAASRSRTL